MKYFVALFLAAVAGVALCGLLFYVTGFFHPVDDMAQPGNFLVEEAPVDEVKIDTRQPSTENAPQ